MGWPKALADVRSGSLGDIKGLIDDVRLPRKVQSLHVCAVPICHMHRSNLRRYSITSSARAISVGGTVSPSFFAALRLITRSNLVGC